MKKNNKKQIFIVTIIVVLALIAVVTATTYAVFTATFTGTKENKLSTGYVTMSCNETVFNLENTHELSDSEGINLSNNEATCTLTTSINGKMTLGYDVALTEVTPSTNLTENNIKIRALKVKNGNTTYLVGNENTGALINSIKNRTGQYDTSITNYKIDSATTGANEEVVYKVKAWVASQDNAITTTNTDGYCSDTTKTTKEACEASGNIWGYDQKKQQAGGSFSFKLKVGASQVLS